MKNGEYEMVIAPADYPGKKYRGRYVYEHHLVWWRKTGKLPPPGHVVHHKNENKRDNRFRNLELKTRAAHTRDHCHGPRERILCAWCGRLFELRPSVVRDRKKRSRSGLLFCSRKCGTLNQRAKAR